MSQALDRLKTLLAELFQMDQADLDFGIYRIMNAKRQEIDAFLDKDLLPQVSEAFQGFQEQERAAKQAKLNDLTQKAKELGADPEVLPQVQALRAELAEAVDVTAAEAEVYSHLYNFFRRYYQEGDFISLRRYKEGVYAVPYEGEEVKLYWANHDQYYIKTSEYLRDYTFKLPSGRRVHFKLTEADTAKDNNRAAGGNERRFILASDEPLVEQDGELIIRFEYRPHPDRAKQHDLNAQAVERVLRGTSGFDEWRRELAALKPTERNPSRTLLEKHLADYTARNTFDYFIHKDLRGFLRRELDFYIKNEVMHLDDIETETAPRVEQYLAKVKALRRVAHKIIDFLAQIEDFQKKLWLKKKFVVETQYCVTVDRILAIPDEQTRESLLTAIVENDAQREEWVRLHGIDQMEDDLVTAGYSVPLSRAFLEAHPTLMMDTRHFGEDVRLRLLAAIPDLDEETDGLLIHSENFQALGLLQERYRGQVQCVYIDPPYNTGNDGFAYKDDYRHSSWLAALQGRTQAAHALLSPEAGCFFCSIDDGEQDKLRGILETVFGRDNFVANVIWQKKYAPANDATWLSDDHDFLVLFARSKVDWTPGRLARDERQNQAYSNPDDDARGPWRADNYKCNKTADERPNLYYPIIHPKSGKEIWPARNAVWRYNKEQHERNVAEGRVWWGADGTNETPAYKRFLSEVGDLVPRTIWKYDEVGHNQDGIRQLRALVPDTSFTGPKPTGLIERVVSVGNGDLTLDYFAGSGTTGHAVINLNREDGGRRKVILVEMGEYFDTVLVPRIKKVVFTPEWKDGRPKRMPTPEETERSPRIIKILRLESYEDTLNNLELKRTQAQQELVEQQPGFREDYLLRYALDVETKGSASLLALDRFADPFAYRLNIATGSAGETKPTVVDLVETFNYLLGLRVKTIDHLGGVRVVTGTSPQGERVLVLWRKTQELDNDALDAWFGKQGYNTRDQEFDVIYVNGDNNLENLRKADQTWKVRLIEEEFQRLMFDVADV